MGIVNFKPDVEPRVVPNLPKVKPNTYQTVTIDDNETPVSTLLAYIEGAPWTVNYYSQLLAKDNDLTEIDTGASSVYQQYQKINNLELRVTSPIDTGYDGDMAITTVTGAANIYPFLTPNIGDYFTALAGDTQTGLFRITSVARKSFNKQSVYAVEYDMLGYTATSPEYLSLEQKAIKEYFFDKDRLIEGSPPLLRDVEYRQLTDFRSSFKSMVRYYFQSFFNQHYSTLVAPGQDLPIYDSCLVDYLMRIVDTFDAPEVRLMKQLTGDNDPYLKQPQFWQMLLQRDIGMLDYINQTAHVVSKYAFNSSPFIHGVAFSNIQYLVYPMSADTSIKLLSNQPPKPGMGTSLKDTESVKGVYAAEAMADAYNGSIVANRVLVDSYYVLSEDFYQGTDNQSILEILTRDYISGATLDLNLLSVVTTQCMRWSRLEQFYYMPIILSMIKSSTRAVY